MKPPKIFSLLMLVLTLATFSIFSVGQEAPKPIEQPVAAEPLGENDRIPFMVSEEGAVTAEPSSTGLLLKTLGSMALIIGLIFAAAWAAKKLGYGSAKTVDPDSQIALSVLTSVSLGNGRNISAIRFGSRTLLVGSTPQAFTLLAEDEKNDELQKATPRSVAEMLADDNISFEDHFEKASSQLNLLGQVGRSV